MFSPIKKSATVSNPKRAWRSNSASSKSATAAAAPKTSGRPNVVDVKSGSGGVPRPRRAHGGADRFVRAFAEQMPRKKSPQRCGEKSTKNAPSKKDEANIFT
jgi:hypothetical protein